MILKEIISNKIFNAGVDILKCKNKASNLGTIIPWMRPVNFHKN